MEEDIKVKEYELFNILISNIINIQILLDKTILYIVYNRINTSGYYKRTNYIANNYDKLLIINNPILNKKNNNLIINYDKNKIELVINEKYLIKIIKFLNIKNVILPSNHLNFSSIHEFLYNKNNLKNLNFIYELRGLWFLTSHSRYILKNKLKNTNVEFPEWILNEIECEKNAINKSNSLIFINKSIRNYLINELKFYNLFTKPYIVLYNSCNINKNLLNNKYKKDNKNTNIFKIGYLGTISFYEGVEKLITAVKILINEGYKINLIISGKNEINYDFSSHSFITYYDYLYGNDYDNVLETLDLFCICREKYKLCELVSPIKPLEAMIKKIPILVPDYTCFRELGKEGFYYYEGENINSLVNEIKNIYNNKYDDIKINYLFNRCIDKLNWNTQTKKIDFLLNYNIYYNYNIKPYLEIYSGAVINSINEIIILSKFSNVFYNGIFINDCVKKNKLNIDKIKNEYSILSKNKIINEIFVKRGQTYFEIEKNKYKFYFYRGGRNDECNEFFLSLPETKIYQHSYDKKIWENYYIGFQTETANEYALKDILKYKQHDGTLNYENIDIIPKKTIIRYQCIKDDINYEKQLLKENKYYFNIGIIGTIYKETCPIVFLETIRKININNNIKVIIYTSNIDKDIYSKITKIYYNFVEIDSFNDKNKLDKITKLDLIINTWINDYQDYSGSNKNLDAICYNIPIIIKKYKSYIEQFGCDYELFFENENEIENLILKCMHDLDFYNSIIIKLKERKKLYIIDEITKKWKNQLDNILLYNNSIKKILIVCHNLYIGGVQKYTYQIFNALKKITLADIHIYCYDKNNIIYSDLQNYIVTELDNYYDYILLNSYPITEEEILYYLKYTNKLISICHTEYHIFTFLTYKLINIFYSVFSVSDVIINKISKHKIINRPFIITPCVDYINNNMVSPNINYKIIWCGRISNVKGAHLLVKLYNKYINEHTSEIIKKWKLYIYGNPLKPYLKKEIEQYTNSNIILNLNSYSDNDFNKFIKDADIFINTSYTEGLPYVFINLLNNNVPIISSNVGHISNLIKPEINGDLFNFKGLYIDKIEENFNYGELEKNFNENFDYNFNIFKQILDKYLLNVEKIREMKNNTKYNLEKFTIDNMMINNLKLIIL